MGLLGVSNEAITTPVDALASARNRRLAASRVASLLGVPANRVPMVMSQIAKLLNVEGYPVVSTDPATKRSRWTPGFSPSSPAYPSDVIT